MVGSPDGLFNNYNTHVRSSSLDRTIMTARWVHCVHYLLGETVES